MRSLHLTSPEARGTDVKRLQVATNHRLHARGYPTTRVDGVYGPETAAAVHRAAYLLGATAKSLEQPGRVGVQRMVEHPGQRTPPQLLRARKRKLHPAAGGRIDAVLSFERSQAGANIHETGDSNRGAVVDKYEREFGILGAPWCGAFQGYSLRHYAGVPVTSRVTYCPYIEADAKLGTNGFEKWIPTSDPAAVHLGDLVLFNFEGSSLAEHVGMVNSVPRAGIVGTIEGNTSPTTGGSQDNGGCVAIKGRPLGVVLGFARPRY